MTENDTYSKLVGGILVEASGLSGQTRHFRIQDISSTADPEHDVLTMHTFDVDQIVTRNNFPEQLAQGVIEMMQREGWPIEDVKQLKNAIKEVLARARSVQ
jgi:hypothetical protein